MRILIDADGCPVVNDAIELGNEYSVEIIIFCDTSHVFERKGATTVTVSKGADSVDFALVNRIVPDDIVITQDYGLAAMALSRRAVPISQDGLIYNDNNMNMLLENRHESRKIRTSGGRTTGPKKRTPEQTDAFRRTLRGLLKA